MRISIVFTYFSCVFLRASNHSHSVSGGVLDGSTDFNCFCFVSPLVGFVYGLCMNKYERSKHTHLF